MIFNNKWLWFHIIGGGILAKIFLIWFAPQLAFICVAVVAILWEIYEYFKDDVKRIYGSKKRFYLDAIGDIVGALIMALVVVW